ncbi:MAG: hydrolase [Clostridiales bacterium]|nr:hydrolase [Clostridiales bacterium]
MSLILREDTLFIVIDFQERLMPAMSGKEQLEDKVLKLIKGMKALGIPAIVTQQYTKGIGPTISSIGEALGDFEHIEKTTFSCMANPQFAEKVKAAGKKNVVVCGIEAHICVQQTALQLIEEGYNVYVPADCVSSRSSEDKIWGAERMRDAGAIITSYESVLYELLGDSKAEGFKAVSAIVK